MKKNTDKQFAGAWLDQTKAYIIDNTADGESYSIKDTVKAAGHHGGGSEHTMNNANHSDQLKFFKLLSSSLLSYDEILLFGPGKIQEELMHHLQGDQQFKSKRIVVQTAQQLSDGQMVAIVRDFFSANNKN